MKTTRRMIFPYGMERNADGSWVFFNRDYKVVGFTGNGGHDWDDPNYTIAMNVEPSTLRKLDIHGVGEGNRIYFYDDGSNPEGSQPAMDAYLDRLRIIMKLRVEG